MNSKKLSTMAFVAAMAMATTSCSNDDIVEGGGQPDQNTVVAGEKTWMSLNLNVGEVATRAVGGNGSEAGSNQENSVNSIHLYIFGEDGKLELAQKVEKVDKTDAAYDGKFLAPSTAVEVTSGKKTFCVILNQLGNIDATPGTTLSNFLKSAQTVSSYASLTNGDLMTGGQDLMMTGKTDVTLHAGISKADVEAAADSNELTDDEANNVVTMYVNRMAAKLKLELASGTSLSVTDNGKTLASLGQIQYKVNNLSNSVYYFLQDMDGNQVYPTPYYEDGEYDETWKTKWFNQETAFVTTGTTLYMTPNTHKQNYAKVGNTTYTLVEGVYVPVAGEGESIVTGYNTLSKDFSYATSNTLAAGKTSIFSYEYSVAFSTTDASKDLAVTLDDVRTQLQALVAKRVSEKYTAESDIIPTNITILGSKAEYEGIMKETAGAKVYAYLQPVEVKGQTKKGHYQIVMKRWGMPLGATAASEDKSFNLSPLNIGVYDTATGEGGAVGLKCYYRVNVFTKEFGKGHPMRYSVVRNYSYKVTVTSVGKIGENEEGNVDLPEGPNQNEPIEEATTFMQCSILINKWIASDMSVELGK